MKNNWIYLFTLLVTGLFVTGCNDDNHGDNEITITIEEPLNGATISDCDHVHLHIEIAASDDNVHDVEIILHPEGDVNDKIIDQDIHEHQKLVTFEQELDLCSYTSGTCFHLEVEACADHDCEEKTTADVEFCLQ